MVFAPVFAIARGLKRFVISASSFEETLMRKLGLVVMGSILCVGTVGLAQSGGGGGWGPNGQFARLYDPNTVETVKGEIAKVERVAPMRGMSAGIHLVLKTEHETLTVHLGPEWYVDSEGVKLAPKDRVEVKGSRVKISGKTALLASEVAKGGGVLKLRDEKGVPVWSGRGRGAQQPQKQP